MVASVVPLIPVYSSAHYHLGSGTYIFFDPVRPGFHIPAHIGLFLALAIYGPQYSAMSPYIRGTPRNDPVFIWACTTIWIVSRLFVVLYVSLMYSCNKFAEMSNLITHINLRNLRPAGTRKRAIPQGYGFSLISFPNYFFESLAWFAIALMTGSWTGEIVSSAHLRPL